jgi:hypothetical protein
VTSSTGIVVRLAGVLSPPKTDAGELLDEAHEQGRPHHGSRISCPELRGPPAMAGLILFEDYHGRSMRPAEGRNHRDGEDKRQQASA